MLRQSPSENAEIIHGPTEVSDHKRIVFGESLCIPVPQLRRSDSERRCDFQRFLANRKSIDVVDYLLCAGIKGHCQMKPRSELVQFDDRRARHYFMITGPCPDNRPPPPPLLA